MNNNVTNVEQFVLDVLGFIGNIKLSMTTSNGIIYSNPYTVITKPDIYDLFITYVKKYNFGLKGYLSPISILQMAIKAKIDLMDKMRQ